MPEESFPPYRDEEDDLIDVSIPAVTDEPNAGRTEPQTSHDIHSFWTPSRSILNSASRAWRNIVELSKGPKEIQIQKIEPFFKNVQEVPIRLTERYLRRRSHQILALAFYYASYLAIFVTILTRSAYPGSIGEHGPPVSISCSASFWHDGNGCGLNGNACRPFDNAVLPFRCPASCIDTLMQDIHPIGGKGVIYTPLVIGGINGTGETRYRGDSLICQSAIHAGIISNTNGGCGIAVLKGEQDGFVASRANGIQSYAFDSVFPKSYSFLTEIPDCPGCRDVRWDLLVISVIYTSVLSIFVTSPLAFFWSSFFILFLHVALVSDPPDALNIATLGSIFISRLIPASFIGFVYYRYTIKRTLSGLQCQFEKTILWLGGAWTGALNNYTFKDIPIQRLTPHDLQQPGAIPALIIIVSLLLLIAVSQAYYLWLEHRFRRYLALYATFIGLLLLGVAMPGMHLRIHHYLLAMLLLPGTSMQTRPSLLFQGILIGLFMNGVARWGFAPILETPEMLYAGRPEINPIPRVSTFLAPDLSRLDISWSKPPLGYNGVTIQINDVERYKWYTDSTNATFSWFSPDERLHKEYIRLSYLHESTSVEYTKAGVWDTDRSWSGFPS